PAQAQKAGMEGGDFGGGAGGSAGGFRRAVRGWDEEIPRSHFSKRRTRRWRSRWHGKIRSPALYPDPRRTSRRRSSVFGESGRGKWFGRDRHLGVIALLCQHFPGDRGHAAGGDGDRLVGSFAAGA